MRPEHRINGQSWTNVLKDIERNPHDFTIKNKDEKQWLETRTGLVIWRDGSSNHSKVYTCRIGDKNQSQFKNCYELVRDLPETTDKNINHRKAAPVESHQQPRRAMHPAATPSTSTSSSATPTASTPTPVQPRPSVTDMSPAGAPTQEPGPVPILNSPLPASVLDQRWVDFHTNPSQPLPGVKSKLSLDEIHQLDDKGLEDHHDYIQIMFPGRRPGQQHTDETPLLTDTMVQLIQKSPAVQQQILNNLDLMLKHWGIYRDGENFHLIKNAWGQSDRWLPPPNSSDDDHNKLRISRTLAFLHECGFQHGHTLHNLLQTKREQNGVPRCSHWDQAVGLANIQPQPVPPSPEPHAAPLPERLARSSRSQPVRHTGPSHTGPQHLFNEAPEFITPPAAPGHKPSRSHYGYSIPVKQSDGSTINVVVRDSNYDRAQELLANSGAGYAHAHKLNDKTIGAVNGAVRFYDKTYDARHQVQNEYLTNTYIHRSGSTNGQAKSFTVPGDGNSYRSVEHYFQSRKFIEGAKEGVDPNQKMAAWQDVLNANSGGDASRAGKRTDYGHLIDFDKWNQIKQDIMYKAVLAKFQQNADLRQRLIATWPNIIIEDTSEQNRPDEFWGSGNGDIGLNITGQILGQIRQELMANPIGSS